MMPRASVVNVDLESRLATTEANVDAITRDVETLVQAVRQQSQAAQTGFDRIHERLSSLGQTSWGTLASWAAVIIAIIGILGSGYIRDLGRLEGIQGKQWEGLGDFKTEVHSRWLTNEYERGKTEQRITALVAAVDKTDLSLQREIKLAYDNSEIKLNDFDRRIQVEIRQLNDALADKIGFLDKQLIQVRDNGSPITRERLSALEAKIDGCRPIK